MKIFTDETVNKKELDIRIKSILKKLTVDEKIILLTGRGAWHTKDLGGAIPVIMMTDGPHGLRKVEHEVAGDMNGSNKATCFPTASAVACSWDTELIAKMAEAIAEEAVHEKVSVVLGPGTNIKRSPLCGRNFEYFSEDPYLAGKMAASYINAVQSKGVGTSLKHFAGNSQETHRQTSNSQIDERALREIYLKPFEIAVKEAQPMTVMASYNKLNGEYSCRNKHLLTDILRNEWGFKGAVISDWGAAGDVTAAIKAGMDLEMPDSMGVHTKQVMDAYRDGKITEKEIDRAAGKIIELVLTQTEKMKDDDADYEEHNRIAEEIECGSAVLLKNDGMLPIKKGSEVIVIGELAEKMRFQGGGSSHINAYKVKSAIESLKETGLNVRYAPGYHSESNMADENMVKDAVDLARTGLPILFFGGLIESFEGEGYDRTSLDMPSNQIELLNKLYDVNKNIVYISFGGSSYNIPFIDKVHAVLHMYLGGQAVGGAVAKLITGGVNPSGKLAETFPLSLEDVPSYKYFGRKSDDVEYRESLYVGYRYYETFDKPVAFPFGYGLSYTSFEYSDIKLSIASFSCGMMKVSFKIKNTGSYAGKEIAEVYIKNPECDYIRPVKELRGFVKVALEPGEEKEVSVSLNEDSFSIYDESRKAFIMPSGNYKVQIGASVSDIRLEADIVVEGIHYDRNDREKLPSYFIQKDGGFEIPKEQFEKLYGRPLSHLDDIKKGEYTVYNSLQQLAEHSLLGKITMAFAMRVIRKMYKGRTQDDPEVMMAIQSVKECMVDSMILQSGNIVPYKLGESIVLSANGHHLKAIGKLIRG